MWQSVKGNPPPVGVVVNTKIDTNNYTTNETRLQFWNNLWWDEKRTMYVYYTPTHWSY